MESGLGSREALREREKELDFVYRAAELLSSARGELGPVLEALARELRAAFALPASARVELRAGGESYASGPSRRMSGDLIEAAEENVALSCAYPRRAAGGVPRFSARERQLCASLVRWIALAAARLEADERERARAAELERKNLALSELISRIEDEKRTIREAMRERLERDTAPILAKLAALEPGSEAAALAALAKRSLSGAFIEPAYADRRLSLSIREREVCELVAAGLSGKEIASRLGIALSTVERHRHNARKKLGLAPRQGSLAAIYG